MHAIRAGTVLLEVQQSSDITYRLYDYDRLQNGKPRALHIQQSKDVIQSPYEAPTLTQKSRCTPRLRLGRTGPQPLLHPLPRPGV